MNIEDFRDYCLSLAGTTEDFPFDESTLVFRVGGKIYALLGVNNFDFVNLKCNPEKVEELREQFNGVKPGYHMNKKHWNSVYIESDVTNKLFLELAKHSYNLVFKSLSKKVKEENLLL